MISVRDSFTGNSLLVIVGILIDFLFNIFSNNILSTINLPFPYSSGGAIIISVSLFSKFF